MGNRLELKTTNRDKKFIEIIKALNKQRRQGVNQIFDCGKLGFIHIWWHGSWRHCWLEPSLEFKELAEKVNETDKK